MWTEHAGLDNWELWGWPGAWGDGGQQSGVAGWVPHHADLVQPVKRGDPNSGPQHLYQQGRAVGGGEER